MGGGMRVDIKLPWSGYWPRKVVGYFYVWDNEELECLQWKTRKLGQQTGEKVI
jgi:hypothetical protein